MSSKTEKPYFALIGVTLDVWGVVEIISDTRSHMTAKEMPAEITAKLGAGARGRYPKEAGASCTQKAFKNCRKAKRSNL